MLRFRFVSLFGLVVVVPLVACEVDTEGGDDVIAADTMAMQQRDTMIIATPEQVRTARTQVNQARDRLRAAWEADNVATVASSYAEDAVLVTAMGNPLRGRQQIQDTLTAVLPMLSGLEVTPIDFEASGKLAYDYGQFRQRVAPRGEQPFTETGSYLLVYERQPDGQWLVVRQIAAARPEGAAAGAIRGPASDTTTP